jgi:3-hydroxyisobutyrate dehydrogenase-like beta-hydroxyacid dehydrogenase
MSQPTIGVIGLGKIGKPLAENLIKSGYRVVGYRRSPTPELEQLGMRRVGSAAEVGAAADVVLSCLGQVAALEETVAGLLASARPGQIVVELGSYKIPEKAKHIAPFAAKGVAFLDGEVSGTPPMVSSRKAAVYLAGDAAAAQAVEPIIKAAVDQCFYFGEFGAATKVKVINNHLLAIHIAAAAEAMSVATRAGIDVATMIKAISSGSGGSGAFGVRAQAMAERRFAPPLGTSAMLEHYVIEAKEMAAKVGRATPMLDRAADLYAKAREIGVENKDIAVMIEVLESVRR